MSRENRARYHQALADSHRLAIVDALWLTDRSPGELARLVGLPANLLAFHLRVLVEAGIVTRVASEADRRRRYIHLVDETAAVPTVTEFRKPLFICTGNSARSPLAAALWQRNTGRPAISAGLNPEPRVHPRAVAAGRQADLDLAGHRPCELDAIDRSDVDVVIAVCDHAFEVGQMVAPPYLHWSISDPAKDTRRFATIIDELDGWLRRLSSP